MTAGTFKPISMLSFSLTSLTSSHPPSCYMVTPSSAAFPFIFILSSLALPAAVKVSPMTTCNISHNRYMLNQSIHDPLNRRIPARLYDGHVTLNTDFRCWAGGNIGTSPSTNFLNNIIIIFPILCSNAFLTARTRIYRNIQLGKSLTASG